MIRLDRWPGKTPIMAQIRVGQNAMDADTVSMLGGPRVRQVAQILAHSGDASKEPWLGYEE